MDDESSHKPDDIHSLSARSHKHLNEGETEGFLKQHKTVKEKPYCDVGGEQVTTKQEQMNKLDLSNAKRQAIILMLSISNEKYGNLREKNRCFNKWREAIHSSEKFTLQLELARLNKEVETVKF